MTAGQTPFDLGASYAAFRPAERRWAVAPAEGWSSVLLLAFMAALVGWAIDDAHWVLGNQALTDFLPWAGILGVLAGTAGALLGRGRFAAHGLGAVFAAVFLTWAVAGAVAPGEDLGAMFRVVGERTWGAWSDLVIEGRATTSEVAPSSSSSASRVGHRQFAAYAALATGGPRRRRRPGDHPLSTSPSRPATSSPSRLYTSCAPLSCGPRGRRGADVGSPPDRDVGNAVSLRCERVHVHLPRAGREPRAHRGRVLGAAGRRLAGPRPARRRLRGRARPSLPGRRADALRRCHVRLDDQHLGPVGLRQHARPLDHHRPSRAAPQVASRRL